MSLNEQVDFVKMRAKYGLSESAALLGIGVHQFLYWLKKQQGLCTFRYCKALPEPGQTRCAYHQGLKRNHHNKCWARIQYEIKNAVKRDIRVKCRPNQPMDTSKLAIDEFCYHDAELVDANIREYIALLEKINAEEERLCEGNDQKS